MGCALPGDGECGAGQDRRSPPLAPGAASGAGSQACRRDAASVDRPASGLVGPLRDRGEPGHDLALPQARGSELQKKTLFATEQARAAVARKRARWQALKRRLDPDRLVFVDETWIKTNMAPLRGWAQRGRRLKGYAPHGHWRTMTFLAALRTEGISAPCVFDGPINTRCFQAWVEQELVPTLKPGDIVILDNLASHKSKAVRQGHSQHRRTPLVPAALLTRPQPDRAGLRQDQTLDAQRAEARLRGHLAPPRQPHRHNRVRRTPELHPKRRIWFRLKRIRSSLFDPATLWRLYVQLIKIALAFKELKHELAIRPTSISARSGSRRTSSSPSSPTACW